MRRSRETSLTSHPVFHRSLAIHNSVGFSTQKRWGRAPAVSTLSLQVCFLIRHIYVYMYMYSLLIARPVAQKRHGVFLPTRKFLTNPYVSAAFAHRRQFVVHLAYAFLIASYIPVSADRARDQGLANNRCGIESDEPEATNVAHPPGGAGCRPGIIPETLRLESSINLPRSKVSAFSSILAVARAWVMHIHVNRNDAINESTPISTRTVPYFHIDEVDGDSWIAVADLIDEDLHARTKSSDESMESIIDILRERLPRGR